MASRTTAGPRPDRTTDITCQSRLVKGQTAAQRTPRTRRPPNPRKAGFVFQYPFKSDFSPEKFPKFVFVYTQRKKLTASFLSKMSDSSLPNSQPIGGVRPLRAAVHAQVLRYAVLTTSSSKPCSCWSGNLSYTTRPMPWLHVVWAGIKQEHRVTEHTNYGVAVKNSQKLIPQ